MMENTEELRNLSKEAGEPGVGIQVCPPNIRFPAHCFPHSMLSVIRKKWQPQAINKGIFPLPLPIMCAHAHACAHARTHTHTTSISPGSSGSWKISLSFENKSVTSINHEKQSVTQLQGWGPCQIRDWAKLELTGGFIPTITLTVPGDSHRGQACFYSLLLLFPSWLYIDNKRGRPLRCSEIPENSYAKIRQKRKTNFLPIFLAS